MFSRDKWLRPEPPGCGIQKLTSRKPERHSGVLTRTGASKSDSFIGGNSDLRVRESAQHKAGAIQREG